MSYEIKKDKSGQFRFNLKAGNGEIILSSEAYVQKSGAMSGIESVQKNGPDESKYELRITKSDQPYFVLKAGNGQEIGHSESYSSEAACKNGMASVQKNCVSTTIKDLTEVAD